MYKYINNDPTSFKMISTIYLFYNLCRVALVVPTCTKYKYINNDPTSFKGDLYYIFILQSLHPCTGYTEYKDICNNLLVSAGIINHILSTEEEHHICVPKGEYLSTNNFIFY